MGSPGPGTIGTTRRQDQPRLVPAPPLTSVHHVAQQLGAGRGAAVLLPHTVRGGFPAVLRVWLDALQLGGHLLPRLPLLPPLYIRGLPPHEGQRTVRSAASPRSLELLPRNIQHSGHAAHLA